MTKSTEHFNFSHNITVLLWSQLSHQSCFQQQKAAVSSEKVQIKFTVHYRLSTRQRTDKGSNQLVKKVFSQLWNRARTEPLMTPELLALLYVLDVERWKPIGLR